MTPFGLPGLCQPSLELKTCCLWLTDIHSVINKKAALSFKIIVNRYQTTRWHMKEDIAFQADRQYAAVIWTQGHSHWATCLCPVIQWRFPAVRILLASNSGKERTHSYEWWILQQHFCVFATKFRANAPTSFPLFVFFFSFHDFTRTKQIFTTFKIDALCKALSALALRSHAARCITCALISSLGTGKWSDSGSGHFTPHEEPPFTYRQWVGTEQ